MLFLLHIVILLHGAFGLLVAKARTNSSYELLPHSVLQLTERLWPSTVYKVWKEGTTEPEAAPAQAYALAGGSMLYALWFLHRQHSETLRR